MAETYLEPFPWHVVERAFLVCDRLRFANLRACSGLNAFEASGHAATVGILDCYTSCKGYAHIIEEAFTAPYRFEMGGWIE